MRKTGLLSAASAIALAVSLHAAPAAAFDKVDWRWDHNTYSDVDALFDIDVDFIAWGLTQVERLQIMGGNMAAYADGSYASYDVPNKRTVIKYDDKDKHDGHKYGYKYDGKKHGGHGHDKYKPQVVTYPVPLDALDQLAKVEISASAISNIATVESEHVVMAHDGQIAFGKFKPVYGGIEHPTQDQAAMASIAMGNMIGWDDNGTDYTDDDMYAGSGNRNFDVAMLAWTAGQFGLLEKGYNSAIAKGKYVEQAQLDVSATAAANIHTVDLESRNLATEASYGPCYWNCKDTTITSENVALVDLTQFGYMDTYAQALAPGHSVSGYKNLGMLEDPVLKVSASALGNVSSVTNKFGGGNWE